MEGTLEGERPSVRRVCKADISSMLAPCEPYTFKIYPPPRMPDFQPGDEVFVKLNSEQDTGRAVVVEPLIQDPLHEYSGRVKVLEHTITILSNILNALFKHSNVKKEDVCSYVSLDVSKDDSILDQEKHVLK
jgi:hypothetical protein